MAIKGSSPKKRAIGFLPGQAKNDAGEERHQQAIVHHDVGETVAHAKKQVERREGRQPDRQALAALRPDLLV